MCACVCVCDYVCVQKPADKVNLPEVMRQELYQLLAKAKYAPMKTGGDFPYLSNYQEYTMLIQVHLRRNGSYHDEHKALPQEVVALYRDYDYKYDYDYDGFEDDDVITTDGGRRGGGGRSSSRRRRDGDDDDEDDDGNALELGNDNDERHKGKRKDITDAQRAEDERKRRKQLYDVRGGQMVEFYGRPLPKGIFDEATSIDLEKRCGACLINVSVVYIKIILFECICASYIHI